MCGIYVERERERAYHMHLGSIIQQLKLILWVLIDVVLHTAFFFDGLFHQKLIWQGHHKAAAGSLAWLRTMPGGDYRLRVMM